MSDEKDKIKNSKRRQKDENAVAKQVKIAKSHHIPVDEPHKLAKKHAANCGNPKCIMCANPRKIFKELTTQERRLFQDPDKPNDRHSNGLKPDDQI